MFRFITGIPGPSGFGSASTSEQVTQGIDASHLTALITGGASGIGFETARVLALRNVHVIIAARNLEAANEAKQLIRKDNKTARLDVLKLDLASLKSVKAFAHDFIALNLRLNILINNAGIMFCPFKLSEDGIEMQFATNYLAHLHTYEEGIQFDKINDESSYSDKKAYGRSKLANILHANELSRRLQAEGANITVNSVHPGLIMTSLYRHSDIFIKTLRLLTYILWKNAAQGSATTCYVALHPALKGVSGEYFVDCNEYKTGDLARDEALAKKLWDFSNKLVDVSQNK